MTSAILAFVMLSIAALACAQSVQLFVRVRPPAMHRMVDVTMTRRPM